MSGAALTFEAAEAVAKAKGLVIKLPQPNELFIDIDNDLDFGIFVRLLAVLEQNRLGFVLGFDTTVSNSGGEHRHVVVRLCRPVNSDLERVALQAMLGSDRKRELLSWVRIESGVREQHPSLFFEKAQT